MNRPAVGDAATTTPERDIARDMARRILFVSPILIAISAAIWGLNGAYSSAFALALVALNFLAAAGLMTWGARISPEALMGAVMFGYLLRLAVITVAVLLVKDFGWVELVPLGLTLVVAHLGILIWETRYVSGSLAYPGLKPSASAPTSSKSTPSTTPLASDQEADRP